MRYVEKRIVFQEIPDETSLAFLISGCPMGCQGCHSAYSWNPNVGRLLSGKILEECIEPVLGWITCVLFLGGEWEPKCLVSLLRVVRSYELKTALYSGSNSVDDRLLPHLDYLKTGSYDASKGGLESRRTNQRLINLRTGEVLNYRFQKNQGGLNDSSQRPAIKKQA